MNCKTHLNASIHKLLAEQAEVVLVACLYIPCAFQLGELKLYVMLMYCSVQHYPHQFAVYETSERCASSTETVTENRVREFKMPKRLNEVHYS